MARPARVDIESGVYHVISRGTERCDLFKEDADYLHFLDRLAEAQRRFRLAVYGFVLMQNHFHLIVCTPDANLSQAVQWLKVSYSMWFNAKYKRVGPLFQGRFKGILVDESESWLLDLSLYVHLNPVRIQKLGLGKQSSKAEALGWSKPERKEVNERLKALRSYRWSSYPYYAGYKRRVPEWLDTSIISGRVESRSAYRKMAEQRITAGFGEGFLSGLEDRLALGAQDFAERVRGMCDVHQDYESTRTLRHRCSWESIVEHVEHVQHCAWEEFSCKRGNWGRAAVYYLARKYGGLTLAEIGAASGGVNYPAVSKMVKRFEQRLQVDQDLKRKLNEIELDLNV